MNFSLTGLKRPKLSKLPSKSRLTPTQLQEKTIPPAPFEVVSLNELTGDGKKYFRLYKDADVFDMSQLRSKSRSKRQTTDYIIEATEDDDVESDSEIVRSGIQQCY